jgi:hypothetical protein
MEKPPKRALRNIGGEIEIIFRAGKIFYRHALWRLSLRLQGQSKRKADQQQVQKAIHVQCLPIIPTQCRRATLSLAEKAAMFDV